MTAYAPRFWFVPTWSGDFRLTRGDAADRCELSIENPTEAERTMLLRFVEEAVDRTWLQPTHLTRLRNRLDKGGDFASTFILRCALTEAGPLLASRVHGDAETWTAIRCLDGSISVETGTALPKVKDVPLMKQPDAVVSVREPARGCPAPAATARRASEVLRTFCTASQWRTWQARGVLRATGNHTGKAYFVFHRDTAAARGMNHSVMEASTGREICVWDWRVPAEEEALGVKLAIEHREAWMLA